MRIAKVGKRRHVMAAAGATAVAASAWVAFLPDRAPADAPCTVATLHDGYAIAGQGQFSGSNIRTIARLVFDGAGKVTGSGIAVLDLPSVAEPYDMTDGTYTVRPDCTATIHFFVHHHTLSPIDHFHSAELVLADGARSFQMIYTSLQFHEGEPSVPIEGILWSGQRQ